MEYKIIPVLSESSQYDIHSFCHVLRPAAKLLELVNLDEKLDFVGKRLFFLKRTDGEDGNTEKCRKFLGRFHTHLEKKRVMLLEGKAGCGKTTLTEEIAMVYISGEQRDDNHPRPNGNNTNNVEEGYAIVTNGVNTLTEQRLFTYKHSGQLCFGPLAKMRQDAEANPGKRFVFILHEWNRTTDFMSLLGNFFESELRTFGPDSWYGDNEEDMRHRSGFLDGESRENSRLAAKLPDNIKIILTGNPAKDDFEGEVADFISDPALRDNRLLGAKVEERQEWEDQEVEITKLENKEDYPSNMIVENLKDWLSVQLQDYCKNSEDHEVNKVIKDHEDKGIMPGKIVAEVNKFVSRKGYKRKRTQNNSANEGNTRNSDEDGPDSSSDSEQPPPDGQQAALPTSGGEKDVKNEFIKRLKTTLQHKLKYKAVTLEKALRENSNALKSGTVTIQFEPIVIDEDGDRIDLNTLKICNHYKKENRAGKRNTYQFILLNPQKSKQTWKNISLTDGNWRKWTWTRDQSQKLLVG